MPTDPLDTAATLGAEYERLKRFPGGEQNGFVLIERLLAALEATERENVRLAAEHTQCHDRNRELVGERFNLKAQVARLRAALTRLMEVDMTLERVASIGKPTRKCYVCRIPEREWQQAIAVLTDTDPQR